MNRLSGLIFGHAIGDALGLGTEFMSKSEVSINYPEGLNTYAQIIRDSHRCRWPVGSWTDDTDQMLCILDSLLALKRVNIHDIAHRFHTWFNNGGMGIGQLVFNVINSENFLTDPHGAAKESWEKSGRKVAPNGGIMRTSIVGAWDNTSAELVKKNTELICQITHYDPRCVGSCVAVSIAVSLLLQGETDTENIMNDVFAHTSGYSQEVYRYLEMSAHDSLEIFDLDEGLNPGEMDRIGYTLKAMGAGFWALRNADSFFDGIQRIINEGGDADTNAAVAGAMLGAKYGIEGIPVDLVQNLNHASTLNDRVVKLYSLFKCDSRRRHTGIF